MHIKIFNMIFLATFFSFGALGAMFADEYKKELEKFNAELSRSAAKAQLSLEKLERLWQEAQAVFEAESLEDIAVSLGAKNNEDIYVFMNNFFKDLKNRLQKMLKAQSVVAAPSSVPRITPPVQPRSVTVSVPSVPSPVSIVPTALPSTTLTACVVRGGVPMRAPVLSSPGPMVAGGVVLPSPRPAITAAPKSINVAQQMLIQDALEKRVEHMRKQGQAIMATVKGNVNEAIKQYFQEKKMQKKLSQSDLDTIDIDGLQARVNSALGLGANFFSTAFGK